MRFLFAVVVALALALVSAIPSVAESAELVVFESPGCGWCAKWNREVRGAYIKSAEGRMLPLRSVMGRVPPPGDFVLERSIVFTPTFVVVDAGHEIARITGYTGEGSFWELLGSIVRDLEKRVSGAPRAEDCHLRPGKGSSPC